MVNEKKSLGRGLDSLLGEGFSKKQEIITQVPLEQLASGQYQPRKETNQKALEELAESIKQQGVLQPIIVRKQASGVYEIVAGERRWRAAQLAGLKTIPAVMKELTNDQVAKISLVENLQREDLNAMDQARGLQRLQMEFDLSQGELAHAVGKSRPSIANLLRLTNLSKEAQKMLEEGKIEMGHARALLTLEKQKQILLAKQIFQRKLSVRQTEALTTRKIQTNKTTDQQTKKDTNTLQLEKELSEALGAKTEVSLNKKKGGKLVISFIDLESLQGILEKIKGKNCH